MGSCVSKQNFDDDIDFDSISDLLSIEELKGTDMDIENLIFGDGGAKSFAYIGALKVLGRIRVLKRIRRFVGVGTGSIIAATVALGLKIKAVQAFFRQCLDTYDLQEQVTETEHVLRISSHFGLLSGQNCIDRFKVLLKSQSLDVDITFGELYKKTGRELCIIVSNVNHKTLEYCHPKTSPDFQITHAILMSLCIPGIFSPYKHSFGQEECLYLSGNLTCSYPLHVFDGWWLSMDHRDDFPSRKPTRRRLHRSTSYGVRNHKSLGLVIFDKFQESNYPELRDRLSEYKADTSIPETILGFRYQRSLEDLRERERQYLLVREGGFKIMRLVGEINKDILCEEELAQMIMERGSITREEIQAVFYADITTVPQCLHALLKLNRYNDEMHKSDLSSQIEARIQRKLTEYYDSDRTTVTSLNTFFGALTNTVQSSTFELGKEDFERTVGILTKYVCSYNTSLENDDLRFLFKQGWNATVAYFLHRKYQKNQAAEMEGDFEAQQMTTISA